MKKWIYRASISKNLRGFNLPTESAIHGFEMCIRPESDKFNDPTIGMAYGKTEEECIERAKLFSQSRELLEALMGLVNDPVVASSSTTRQSFEKAKAAIEKATN